MRRSSRGCLPDEVQAPQKMLVIPTDSIINAELKLTNYSASPSAGRSTAPQGDPLGCDGAACRRSALKGRRRGALGRVDGVCAPAALKRTVVALSARMESIASGGILGSLLGAVSRLWGPGVLPACRPNLRRPQVWSVCGAHALWLCP